MLTKVLQYIWAVTGVFALLLAAYNWFSLKEINQHVYMPFFISIFCYVLYRNVKAQRNFTDKIKEKEQE